MIVFLICLLQPCECLVVVAQALVEISHEIWRQMPFSGNLLQFLEQLSQTTSITGLRIPTPKHSTETVLLLVTRTSEHLLPSTNSFIMHALCFIKNSKLPIIAVDLHWLAQHFDGLIHLPAMIKSLVHDLIERINLLGQSVLVFTFPHSVH